MKSLVILVCLFSTCKGTFNLERKDIHSDETNLVVGAIDDVFTKYFLETSPKVDILIFGLPGGLAETMANNLLRKLPVSVSVKIKISSMLALTEHLSASSILLFDSVMFFKKFKDWNRKFVDERGVWNKHLLYTPGLRAVDVIRKFGDDPTISGVNFLINYDGNSIELATSFLFMPETCNTNQIRTINRYTRRTLRWDNSNFYPNKYENFHECTLYVRPFKGDFGVLIQMIFETLAKNLNFKLNQTDFPAPVQGPRDRNSMLFGLIQEDMVGHEDVKSSALYFDYMTFAVPPGEPLTDLERMFAAFDVETWIVIGITFGIALLTVFVIRFSSRKVQDFVFGRGITTPTLNTLDVFLNGGQNRLPGRNFARFLLMMFIIWSLIIRTCYQSKTFEFLNSDMRHPRVKTIEELQQKNFSTLLTYSNLYDSERYLNESLKYVFIGDDTWHDKVVEPGNKHAYLLHRRKFYYISKIREGRKIIPSLYLLDENVATLPFFFKLPRFFPYIDVFMQKVDQMIDDGFFLEQLALIDIKASEKFVEGDDPQVLTLKSLKLGFLGFLIPLVSSFLVFLFELIFVYTKKATIWLYLAATKGSSKSRHYFQSRV